MGKVATTVKSQKGITVMTYHQTDVVRFTPTKIFLDTGGWFTATTKSRMNEMSFDHDLGYKGYQEKKKWYVKFKDEVIPFPENGKLELKR